MQLDLARCRATWDTFLKDWPLDRLRRMTLQEYTAAGQDHTFTAWIERRLDELGSIWGGSSFKFGIFSRKDKTPKPSGGGGSYTEDYAWYSKYGSTPEEAFAKVKSLVVHVAEAAARGDYAAIDSVDLGEAYKWKIAFHYQDPRKPGVIAVFKSARLEAWLRNRGESLPSKGSQCYRRILALQEGKDLLTLSQQVWEETITVAQPEPQPGPDNGGDVDVDPAHAQPMNLVLYGPPGTGKTYLASELAVRICDGTIPTDRKELMARYRALRDLGRIRFVTFHPSFSYEEFVEGIRPSTENGQVRYAVRAGVFKEAVTHARELFEKNDAPLADTKMEGRKLFKISLGDSTRAEDDWIYPDCLENNYVCIGFATGTDFGGCDTLQAIRERYRAGDSARNDQDYAATAVHYLKNEIRVGDLVLVSEGKTRFRAIGEVAGPYAYQPREAGYPHRRPVRWLWTSATGAPIETVHGKGLTYATIYLMDQSVVKWDRLRELVAPKREGGRAPNCVLVIDEINRANLAKTFGELITLLEPSKRLGQADEQEAMLPYSGDLLGVPPNLYLVGTMNTADRSIALMDTALRRRFAFREMLPRPELLSTDVESINLRSLLTAMNARIEGLFDRDHVLGHTYLMDVASFDDLVFRFQSQIIPLLQEYFFEDWRRIQIVFNDVDKARELQIVEALGPLEAEDLADRRLRFRINPTISPAAIQKIYA